MEGVQGSALRCAQQHVDDTSWTKSNAAPQRNFPFSSRMPGEASDRPSSAHHGSKPRSGNSLSETERDANKDRSSSVHTNEVSSGVVGSRQRRPSTARDRLNEAPSTSRSGAAPLGRPQRPSKRAPAGCRITIHVFDEARNMQQDFTCGLPELLKGMRYFQDYLSGIHNEEVEMSVHCDVVVFEWLLNYVEGKKQTRLDVANCVPILISSDFLKMDALIDDCVRFVASNLKDVAAMPIDLSCLAEPLLVKLAAECQEDALEAVRAYQDVEDLGGGGSDRDDRSKANSNARQMLVSKLYRLKLERLIQTHQGHGSKSDARERGEVWGGSKDTSIISWCEHCKGLYSTAAQSVLVCPQARIFVNLKGVVIAEHEPVKRWETTRYLQALRAQRHTWREVYWHVWGLLHVLLCRECSLFFPVSQLDHCCFHSEQALFFAGANEGMYPCCRRPALRFDSTQTPHSQPGCKARQHSVADHHQQWMPQAMNADAAKSIDIESLMKILRRNHKMVVVPFIPLERSLAQDANKPKAPPPSSDNRILNAQSVLGCLHAGLLDDHDMDEDDENDFSGSSNETSDSRFSEASSSCCSSSDEEQSKPLRRAQASRVRRSLRRHPKSGAQYAQAAMGNLAPNLQKALRQDCMREDDESRLEALVSSLAASRTDSARSVSNERVHGSHAKVKHEVIQRVRPGSARAILSSQNPSRNKMDQMRNRGGSRLMHW
eukprot:CAMPEP_0114227344 /NCGR_PEP_ID=MMETSP0058-20121206/1739_1 /TAXON_ID=36894 /ORGANISM="Pyramimonas parkeae, CCMP726" /LENGTH=716 /DNA_ID=CAMNT_0001338177 /DNA_START=451 /DNA_END=2598 /DNA_ORIENTATION=+